MVREGLLQGPRRLRDAPTAKEITKAYRKLARDSHPDTHPGDAKAEERFKEVSAAYDVLGDEEKRKEYDEVRRLGPAAGGFGGGDSGRRRRVQLQRRPDGLGDLLGQMFGRGRRGRRSLRRRRSATRRRRRGDADARLRRRGAGASRRRCYLTTDAQCSTCNGSGAKPGTAPKVCSHCGGRGVIDDNQGFFSLSSPCPQCGGRGVQIEDPCPTCRGSGVEQRQREVQARIPAGVADGQKIRLKGRGAPGRNGGPAGDLIVECHVTPHRQFGRDGNNLTVRVPISFAEAALGGDIEVPTLDGPTVTLRLRAGHADRLAPSGEGQGHRDGEGRPAT